jgi:hypothetical protein
MWHDSAEAAPWQLVQHLFRRRTVEIYDADARTGAGWAIGRPELALGQFGSVFVGVDGEVPFVV